MLYNDIIIAFFLTDAYFQVNDIETLFIEHFLVISALQRVVNPAGVACARSVCAPCWRAGANVPCPSHDGASFIGLFKQMLQDCAPDYIKTQFHLK